MAVITPNEMHIENIATDDNLRMIEEEFVVEFRSLTNERDHKFYPLHVEWDTLEDARRARQRNIETNHLGTPEEVEYQIVRVLTIKTFVE